MERYKRQIDLKEIGITGQTALRDASVLIIGAGGLGSPVSIYLTAAGVGRIGIVDGDTVSVTNLQRQILYSTRDIGNKKTVCAEKRLKELSPDTTIETYPEMLSESNAIEIATGYDIIVDGCDNASTRYLINDTAVKLGIPYVYGAVSEFTGLASLFNYKGGKSYKDLFPQTLADTKSSAGTGIIGALPGIIGSIEAMEAIKAITGAGQTLRNRLLTVNSLSMEFEIYDI